MNQRGPSGPDLPLWARAADGLTLALGLLALYVGVFGGIRIGAIFSMSTPWRALSGLFVLCALRHCLVRASPLHERIRRWLAGATAPAARLGRAMVPPRLPRDPPNAARLEALHLTALCCMAVAQPIFDVVARSPEFLVAHDARTSDLLALAAFLCFGIPAGCVLLVHLAGLSRGWRWRRRAAATLIGGLAGAIALAALKPVDGGTGGLAAATFLVTAFTGAVAHLRFPPFRLFVSFLAPAVVAVPVAFLLSPGVSRVLAPTDEVGAFDDMSFSSTPPVVVVVFDQFQLAALLDSAGAIDRATFPNFAALADDATWFRNATAVANMTIHALPAVVTGNYPVRGRLPVAADHPGNLFTLLGGQYRLHVEEPLTELCPESLCPAERPGFVAWLAQVLRDLAVVYPRVLLPDGLVASLPPVDQTWKDFAANAAKETFQNRWRSARTEDRGASAHRFIESITAAGPTLHFLHVLLPHEPWTYLPTGQRFTFQRQSVGLRDGRWSEDSWAAALNYQRYLLQAGYADTLLGRLVERLRQVGIYDEALIVVTADHGASLRPGMSFRRPDGSSFEEIAAVPLLLKRPWQRRGTVNDANVEVVDIVPTVAAELGAAAPWTVDGTNALDAARTPRPTKVMFFDRASRRMEAAGDLRRSLIEGAAQKFRRLETGNPLDVPTPEGRYGELIGRAVDPLRAMQPASVEVVVDTLPLLRNVDPDADFIPAHITGAVISKPEGAPAPVLAVAVNGTVAAVTRPYRFPVMGRTAAWEAIVHPGSFLPGANALEVLEVQEGGGDGTVALAAAHGALAANRWPNLVREELIQALGGRTSGFHGIEWADARPFRWTNGDARLRAPIDPRSPPTELAVQVVMTGGAKRLQVAVDGCQLLDETIRDRWQATFDLEGCALRAPEVEIALLSDTHDPASNDSRSLGVAVGRIELRAAVP